MQLVCIYTFLRGPSPPPSASSSRFIHISFVHFHCYLRFNRKYTYKVWPTCTHTHTQCGKNAAQASHKANFVFIFVIRSSLCFVCKHNHRCLCVQHSLSFFFFHSTYIPLLFLPISLFTTHLFSFMLLLLLLLLPAIFFFFFVAPSSVVFIHVWRHFFNTSTRFILLRLFFLGCHAQAIRVPRLRECERFYCRRRIVVHTSYTFVSLLISVPTLCSRDSGSDTITLGSSINFVKFVVDDRIK